ncbi:MAG: response regulator [Verrucomicrobia bacterium]|nr:response regulator [Verrucomicrobiota bacterium]
MNTPAPALHRILIVDDTASIHLDFAKILALPPADAAARDALATAVFGDTEPAPAPSPPRYDLDAAYQGAEALELVQRALAAGRPYALAFVDMRMPPGWDGLETIGHLWAADPELQIVICTAYSDHTWSTIRERLGQSSNLLILKKPFDHVEVLQLAHSLTTKWELASAHRARLDELDRAVRHRTDELVQSEARFTAAFNASPIAQAILAHEPGFAILAVNRAFESLFHTTPAELARTTTDNFGRGVDPERWRALLERVVTGEEIDDYPFVFRLPGEPERHIRCVGRRIQLNGRLCSIWLLRDVTQQLELEQQLRQSQKLDAIGQLSAGIAHDFNNILTAIQGYAGEIRHLAREEEVRRMAVPIQTAATRAAALTRQLLVFARKQILQPELADLNEVFAELRPLLRRLIGADIEIRWNIPANLPRVVADIASFEQVVVNLVVNARDAMPRGGCIEIAARPLTVDAEAARRQIDARPGDFIEISVADTGTGIAPETLPHVFEPFFTTKEPGKGTGLGLSTVYAIVHQQGGWVTVKTQPGAGTTFTLYHPVAPAAPTVEPPAAPGAPGAPVAQRGAGRFGRALVAEDDEIVRELLPKVLANERIPSDVAPNGRAALELWRQSPGAYDLVITDMVMPGGISGLALLHEIRTLNPGVPAILMTGYSNLLADRPDALSAIPGPPPRVLLKPFHPCDFAAALAEIAPPAA